MNPRISIAVRPIPLSRVNEQPFRKHNIKLVWMEKKWFWQKFLGASSATLMSGWRIVHRQNRTLKFKQGQSNISQKANIDKTSCPTGASLKFDSDSKLLRVDAVHPPVVATH
jgi:hypothetical protein